VQLTGLNVIW